MKAVFDTNVLISALIKAGKPRDLLFRMANEEILVLSKGIIERIPHRSSVSKDKEICQLPGCGSFSEFFEYPC
jgi:predicted nucleic acid-binding protein